MAALHVSTQGGGLPTERGLALGGDSAYKGGGGSAYTGGYVLTPPLPWWTE